MGSVERRQTAAWIALLAATFASFWAAGHFVSQLAAIAVSMALAATKVIIVLHRFMHGDRLATPMKIYFLVWTAGCAAMILGVAAFSV